MTTMKSYPAPAPAANPLRLLWQDMRADPPRRGPGRRARPASAWRARGTSTATRSSCSSPTSATGRSSRSSSSTTTSCSCSGPEANHYVLVSHASNFLWRAGHLRDLIPLMGDGLLTIDGSFHRTPPQADAAGIPPRADRGRHAAMQEEVDRALDECSPARRLTSTTGRGRSRCGSRCARCSESTPTGRARAG